MFAYTAHLVPPDTLWDPEAGDGVEGDIYEHASELFDMIGVFEVIEDAVSKQFWLLRDQGGI